MNRWLGRVFLGTALTLTAAATAAATTANLAAPPRVALTWCLQDLPPRQYYPADGQPYGPMVDFMKTLAATAKVQLKFTPPTPVSRCLWLMQQGRVDLMIGLVKSNERASYMHMWPFDVARPASLFTLNTAQLLSSVQDLRGRRVVLVDSHVYADEIRAELTALQVQIVRAASNELALATLLYQDADVMVAPYHITLHSIAQNPRFKSIVAQEVQLESTRFAKSYLAFSRQSKYADHASQLEQALTQVLAQQKTDFYQVPAAASNH